MMSPPSVLSIMVHLLTKQVKLYIDFV